MVHIAVGIRVGFTRELVLQEKWVQKRVGFAFAMIRVLCLGVMRTSSDKFSNVMGRIWEPR